MAGIERHGSFFGKRDLYSWAAGCFPPLGLAYGVASRLTSTANPHKQFYQLVPFQVYTLRQTFHRILTILLPIMVGFGNAALNFTPEPVSPQRHGECSAVNGIGISKEVKRSTFMNDASLPEVIKSQGRLRPCNQMREERKPQLIAISTCGDSSRHDIRR